MSSAASPRVGHFLHLLEYEAWANERSLLSLRTVPEDAHTRAPYLRAVQLMPHIALARMVWLMRLREMPYESPPDWFPPWELEHTAVTLRSLDGQWRAFLSEQTEAGLDRAVHYTSSEGQHYRSVVADVVTHVFQHGSYHRGQLARLVHESGGQRAATDFIFFTRVQE